jgi:thiol:disulfide interchange protein DsbD
MFENYGSKSIAIFSAGMKKLTPFIFALLFSIAAYSQTSKPSSKDFPLKVKYGDYLISPRGFQAFFDLDEGLAYAKKVKKPLIIDFTGHGSILSRRMEALVWADKEVSQLIKEEFVLIQLYVDERNIKMPADKTHYSKILKRNTDNLGNWNGDFQIEKYGSDRQPFYVLAAHNLDPLVKTQGANFNAREYADYLRSGLDAFEKNKGKVLNRK